MAIQIDVKGPTGSGKSTVLDIITKALKSAGLEVSHQGEHSVYLTGDARPGKFRSKVVAATVRGMQPVIFLEDGRAYILGISENGHQTWIELPQVPR